VEKYGRAGQVKYDNITWRMRFAWWITKATDTHKHTQTYTHTNIICDIIN